MTKTNEFPDDKTYFPPEKRTQEPLKDVVETSDKANQVVTGQAEGAITPTSKKKIAALKNADSTAQVYTVSFDQLRLRRNAAPESYPFLKYAQEQNRSDVKQLSNSYQRIGQSISPQLIPKEIPTDPDLLEKEIAFYQGELKGTKTPKDHTILEQHIAHLERVRDSSILLIDAKQKALHEEEVKQKFNFFSIQAEQVSKNAPDTAKKIVQNLQNQLKTHQLGNVLKLAQHLQREKIPKSLATLAKKIEDFCTQQLNENKWIQTQVPNDPLVLGKDPRDQHRYATTKMRDPLHLELQHSFADRLQNIPTECEIRVTAITMSVMQRLSYAEASALNNISAVMPLRERTEYLLSHYRGNCKTKKTG